MDIITQHSTSGLSLLLHGVISLPDVTSINNMYKIYISLVLYHNWSLITQHIFFIYPQTGF